MKGNLSDWSSITPQNTALIVIDMQKDFYAPDGYVVKRGKLVSKMYSITKKVERFAQTLANKGILVIYTRFISKDGITPKNLITAVTKEGFTFPCVKGSGGEEIYDCAIPKEAILIDKPHYDAFAYTNIQTLLKKRNIQNVLISGVRTEVCVDATAKRAASEGYNSFILSDLVQTYDGNQFIHEHTLAFFNDYYGFVVTSDDILQELNK